MSTKISIRMDDITPDMDWTKFMRFKALCDKYRIRPLVGVVPDNQDPNLHLGKPVAGLNRGPRWGFDV